MGFYSRRSIFNKHNITKQEMTTICWIKTKYINKSRIKTLLTIFRKRYNLSVNLLRNVFYLYYYGWSDSTKNGSTLFIIINKGSDIPHSLRKRIAHWVIRSCKWEAHQLPFNVVEIICVNQVGLSIPYASWRTKL